MLSVEGQISKIWHFSRNSMTMGLAYLSANRLERLLIFETALIKPLQKIYKRLKALKSLTLSLILPLMR